MRKSRIIIYIEFFKPQNPEEIERKLRQLQKKKQFPPFRTLLPMVHHKNLKDIKKDIELKVNPPIVL
jgi:hypothetical protein